MTIADLKKYLPQIGLGIAGFAVIVGLCLYAANAMASKDIDKAKQREAALPQQVDDLQKGKTAALNTAAAFKAKSDALETSLTEARRLNAAMEPQPPVHNPNDAPTATADLAKAFASEGFPPVVEMDALKWTTADARPMLPLIQDGKNYPLALERIGNLESQTNILSAQKDDLGKANEALQTANGLAEGQITALQGVHAEDGKIIGGLETKVKVEKGKGWFKGGIGIAIGYAIKALLVAL